jgi:hypothetical protein
MNIYRTFVKRLIDIVSSGTAMFILSVPMVVVAVLLHFANKGGGAFFFQERPGKDGKIFKVVKFKSMTDERDEDGKLLPNEKRITKIGNIIRKTSLDELPQLWNVFKGDMSLIGPRPLLPRYLSLYTPEQARRHEVRPGITGWAQVNGRNNISWTEKFKMDTWYVDNCTFFLDLKIVAKTIKNVLLKKGINSGNDKVGSIGFDGTN